MLISILSAYKGNMGVGIALLLVYLICVLLALICHEVAHGTVAYWLGDPTAKQEGRLTLNPMAHLDPVGFLMMLMAGFGWARPVPVNPRRLRKPRRDMALVSFAGPAANLLLALISGLVVCMLAAFGFYAMDPYVPMGEHGALNVICFMLQIFMQLNVGLALFNLIPLPPLDGSNILVTFLRPNAAAKYLQLRLYTRYIFLGIIALSFLSGYSYLAGLLDSIIWMPFLWLRDLIITGIYWLGGLMFGLF